MMKLSDHEPDSREIRNITDALINLYAAYVNSSLFSYDNPLITDSLKNAYNCLQSVFRKKKVVHLETAEGRLMFEGVMLEGDMLVLSNVAAWLSSRNIKKLTISDDLMRRELANFHKLISTKVSGNEELAKAMSEKNITSIIVQEAEPADSGGPEKALLDKTADQGTVGIYDGAMYQTDRGDASVSGESMFHNGLPDFYMNTMFDLEGGMGSASSSAVPPPLTSPGEEDPTNHNASYEARRTSRASLLDDGWVVAAHLRELGQRAQRVARSASVNARLWVPGAAFVGKHALLGRATHNDGHSQSRSSRCTRCLGDAAGDAGAPTSSRSHAIGIIRQAGARMPFGTARSTS